MWDKIKEILSLIFGSQLRTFIYQIILLVFIIVKLCSFSW